MHRHSSSRISFAGLCAILAMPACGDDTAGSPRQDGGASEAGPAPAMDAKAIDTSVDMGNGTTPTGVVVVNSDYSTSSVSFLDRDGNLLMDGCLNSGSGSPGLSMTLSGDVVLPTQVPASGPVAIVDRGNAAITWLDATTCASLGQLAVGTGFASNPHDVVTLSASKAYVTRQDQNLSATPTPDDFDDGNDVLIVDPSVLKIVGRIDLLPFAPTSAAILPRADRALLAQGRVFVSLNAISANYASYGLGRVVIIDPATDQVTGVIDLPGVKNCGAMTYVAETKRLFVACNGAYGDKAAQAAGSAIVAIDLGQTPPTVVAQAPAASAGSAPLSNLTVAALDGATALAVAEGTLSNAPPDGLWSLPLDGGAPVNIFDSAGGFAIGAVLYDPEHHRVLAADAGVGTTTSPAYLRIFDYSSGVFVAGNTVKTNPKQKLPPRALAFY